MSHESNESYKAIVDTLLSLPAPVLPPPRRPADFDLKPLPRKPDLTSRIAALSLHPALETLLHILNADLASAHFYVRHMQSPPSYDGMLLHALLHRYEGDLENARAWYGDITGSSVMQFVWGWDEGEVEKCNDSNPACDRSALRSAAAKAVEHDTENGNHRKGGPDGKEIADEDDPNEPGSNAAKSTSISFKRASVFLDDLAKLNQSQHAHDNYDGADGAKGSAAWDTMHADLERISVVEVRRLLAWCEAKYGTDACLDASDAWVRPSEKIQKMAKDQMMGGEGWRDF